MSTNNSRDQHAPTEHTPLVTTVPTAPYHRAHRSTTLTRFIYLVAQVSIFFTIIYLLVLLPLNLVPTIHNPFSNRPIPHRRFPGPENKHLPLEKVLKILHDTPDPEKAKQWSRYYTSGSHLAGKNYSQALWTKEKWESWGIKSEIVEYEVLLNYPVGHRLALIEDSGKNKNKVLFEAKLEEDALDEDDYSRLEGRTPTFHGYSANGNVTKPYIFGGYCTFNDFRNLEKWNVPVKDHIVLCRYGYIFRGLKVKGAQDLGAAGVVIFTDPADDHPASWGGGGGNGSTIEPYPKGDSRQPSSVQRGSVQFLSLLPGDPTTPGYASKPGVPREDPSFAIPSIPSIPISYTDAIPILKALNGWGLRPKGWEGDLEGEGVEYWTGPIGYKADSTGGVETVKPSRTEIDKATSTLLNLNNEVTYTTTPIWDVIGVINGSIPDEIVVVGNHRDAWGAGAADPGSGSTALIELVRTFGALLKKDWKPLRTIILASWDGEEYGLLGSTEWVEDHRSYLLQNAVAYLNLDVATSGSEINVASAPLLHNVLLNALKTVEDPLADKKRKDRERNGVEEYDAVEPSEGIMVVDHSEHDRKKRDDSIYNFWGHKVIRTIGSGSDFTAFQDMVMIPSVDFSFKQGKDGAVYHYHSVYDSYDWMVKYGDPGFLYHIAATKILGTMAVSLSESPVLPFNLSDYAKALEAYTIQAKLKFDEATPDILNSQSTDESTLESVKRAKESIIHLEEYVQKLENVTKDFDEESTLLANEVANFHSIPWYRWWLRGDYWNRIRTVNNKIQFFERKFAYEDGLDGRNVFKHVVFAPGLWTGYSGSVFPGIVESIELRNWTNVERWSEIIQKCVIDATRSIE